ncbi:transposase [Marinobacteraceae bacterium S3BR75-40.1]
MSTLSVTQSPKRRRQFSKDFKARIVAACQQPGASVSRIALDNGLNANMVRRWISESRRTGSNKTPAFVPLNLPAVALEGKREPKPQTIRIEIPRAGGAVIVEWPAEQAHQCAALLRELLA